MTSHLNLSVTPITFAMFTFIVIFSVFSYAMATPASLRGPRIMGGEVTTIDRYPYMAALLYGPHPLLFSQYCGSSILNSRSILTAARCFWNANYPELYRIRVGSTYAHYGGVVHDVSQIIQHQNYDSRNHDSDVAIVRSDTVITFNDLVQPAAIAGANYNLLDNQPVWTVGWGYTSAVVTLPDNRGRFVRDELFPGIPSEQLLHVQLWTVNQDICRSRYGDSLTDTMLCAAVLDVEGKGQCTQDTGGPILHHGVVVGITSWQNGCGNSYYPGVNTRVSNFTTWIQANA